ncbi:expressed unknown protein [Seminavis robusta]|uniref:YHYH domain-containing protein n=1 Tax=Seminavis robusta TaxID=568900 RepID=A0A9N8EGZ0_9STRA|nr:expressed unknown protein [Seminavis robusta]|eukprot:Sro921_g220390.1 n/a (365) ;mRNA; r:20267-21361
MMMVVTLQLLPALLLLLTKVSAQPPGGGGGGRPGGRPRIQCSLTTPFTGNRSDTPRAAPLRGNVGCVDLAAHALRQLPIRGDQEGVNIYGPMEAGFGSGNPRMACLGDVEVPGGIDTNLAEHMVHYICRDSGVEIQVLDACGGHAMPYHYHERMSCLFTADPVTLHSTRIGTAGDGNGIYGKHVDGGVEPDDLDACGGRFGVTPDSNGQVVYYYSITSAAPFSVGCYGPVNSVQECRDMYPETCGGGTIETVTTIYGTGLYTLDCPCFDKNQSNVIGQGRPGYLEPLEDVTTNNSNSSNYNFTTTMDDEENEVAVAKKAQTDTEREQIPSEVMSSAAVGTSFTGIWVTIFFSSGAFMGILILLQ